MESVSNGVITCSVQLVCLDTSSQYSICLVACRCGSISHQFTVLCLQ